jgi:hypothetical protein
MGSTPIFHASEIRPTVGHLTTDQGSRKGAFLTDLSLLRIVWWLEEVAPSPPKGTATIGYSGA